MQAIVLNIITPNCLSSESYHWHCTLSKYLFRFLTHTSKSLSLFYTHTHTHRGVRFLRMWQCSQPTASQLTRKASEVVRSFIFKKMSKNFRIIWNTGNWVSNDYSQLSFIMELSLAVHTLKLLRLLNEIHKCLSHTHTHTHTHTHASTHTQIHKHWHITIWIKVQLHKCSVTSLKTHLHPPTQTCTPASTYIYKHDHKYALIKKQPIPSP